MIRLSVGMFCALVLGATAASALTLPIMPVPDAPAQAKSREMIRKVFEKEFAKTTSADKLALAKLLIQQGKETPDDTAARYVAWQEAVDLAASCGDAPTAFAAVDELVRFYPVNSIDLRRQTLVKAHAASTTQAESEAIMQLALQTASAAASEDRFLGSIGRAQRFGTQYGSTGPGAPFRLKPVEDGVTDALRHEFAAPTLDEAKAREAEMNK